MNKRQWLLSSSAMAREWGLEEIDSSMFGRHFVYPTEGFQNPAEVLRDIILRAGGEPDHEALDRMSAYCEESVLREG